jgi:hypothetical protein
MSSDLIEESIEKIVAWAESLPKGSVELLIERNPTVNYQNADYFVDCEIKIIPRKSKSLGITIWLSDDAIGFFWDDFGKAANLIGCGVAKSQSNLVCAGTEPVTYIDIHTLLVVCRELSNANLKLLAGKVLGKLKGVYTAIKVDKNRTLDFVVGLPVSVIKLLSSIGFAEVVSIKIEAW